MPRLSRWFIRTALCYLALGFTLGGLLLWNKGLPFAPGMPRLLPAHMEFLLVGWTIQLVMGVALWIFPRFGVPGLVLAQRVGWTVYALLNAGVWLVVAGANGPGRVLEALAAALFAAQVWRRVRASGLSAI